MDLAMKKAKETGIGWISCHGKIHTIPIEKIFTKSAGGTDVFVRGIEKRGIREILDRLLLRHENQKYQSQIILFSSFLKNSFTACT
jgi:hypothetical protein